MIIRFNKRIGLLGACAIAAMPMASHAKQSAMDTCIQTFIAEELPQGHKIEVVKRPINQLTWGATHPTKIRVDARGKRSGKDYGSATCEMNQRGELVAMVVKGERIRFARATQPKAGTRGG